MALTAIATAHNPDEGQLSAGSVTLLIVAALAVPARLWFPRAALGVAWVATLLAWTFARPPGPVFVSLVITLVYAVLAAVGFYLMHRFARPQEAVQAPGAPVEASIY